MDAISLRVYIVISALTQYIEIDSSKA